MVPHTLVGGLHVDQSKIFGKMKMKWAAAAILVVSIIMQFMISSTHGIGVNWGTQAAQNMNPATIVQLLKDNKIDQVKLFDSEPSVLKRFANTGIEVMPAVPNKDLPPLAKSLDNAKDYVKNNITKFLGKGGVHIRYIAVGNEPFLKAYNGSNLHTLFPAVKNVQKALNEAGLGDKIKVTVPQNADVYDDGGTGKPTNGNFRSDIRQLMVDIVKFFHANNAPFLVNIYPFLSLYENENFPIDFAFFDGAQKSVEDGNTKYENMFDANMDTLMAALKRNGIPKMKVIIGEIGWPTGGHEKATVELAHKFYRGWFKKMATKKGTPKYPGDIEYYLFSLTDENQKSIAPGEFERHWGMFTFDGLPKFPIDITGGGNEKWPSAAKNVKRLEKKWCVFNTDIKILTKAQANFDYACSRSDCTLLSHNTSCSKLDKPNRYSYAFNMYFQMNNQDVTACVFEGLARIVEKDPSFNNCKFPIGIEDELSHAWRLGMPTGLGVVASSLLVFLVLLF